MARLLAKVSQAWERPAQEVLEDLPGQAWLNRVATGPQPNGPRHWAGGFRAGLDPRFKSDLTRRADVRIAVLGTECDGVLGWDGFWASRRSPREFGVGLPFGLAHRIRALKFLTPLPEARERASGERWPEALRRWFGVIQRRAGRGCPW